MDNRKDKNKFKKMFGGKDNGKLDKDRKDGKKMTELRPFGTEEMSRLSKEEIEQQFQLMLEDMNLTAEQTKSLREKPIQVKIDMLMNHKASLVSSKNNDPEHFVNVLRNPQNSTSKLLQSTLDELLVKLRSNGVSWIRSFNSPANDGLNCLLRFLALALTGYYPDHALSCLRCIRVLGNCGYGLYALVDHETASIFIARCLETDKPQLMECAIELLSSVALCDAKGYQKVVEGLTCSAELANSPGDRFVPLLKALDSSELARASLQLINVLVNRGCLSDGSFDVDYRIHLRLELNQLGIGEKITKLSQSQDEVIQKHIEIYQRKAEEDMDALFDRLDAVKCDLDDPNQVYQILSRTLTGTKSETKFLSILQHLLFVRDEPSRFSYYTLLEELISQVVMQVDGFDPDPRSVILRLDVEATVTALLEGVKQVDSSGRDSELKKKLDQALQAKLEAEATIHTLQKQLEASGIKPDGKVKAPDGLEDQLRSATGGTIPPPPNLSGSIPPPPPLGGGGIPLPPPIGGIIPPPPPILGGGVPIPPPLVGGGGLPPPPPLGGKLPQAPSAPQLPFGMKPKKKYTVDGPLKKANWDKITPDLLSKEAIWVQLNEENLESPELFESLKSQFSTKPAKAMLEASTVDGNAVGGCGVAAKRTKSLRFLDGKTAQNLSIVLGSLKVPYAEIRRRLITVDETLLTANMVEQLIKSLPEPSVITQISELKDQYDELAEPEQFLCTIGTIKKLLPRLQAILFKLRFDERRDDIKPEIVDADEALREIQSSKHLRRVLEVVLLLGNYMNSGSRNAQSIGFQISFLTKLEATKDVSNQITLLHFIVNYLDNKFPEASQGIIDDLAHVDRACRFSEDNTRASIAEMKKSLNLIETELRTYKPQEPDDAYLPVMTAFIESAKTQMTQLETMFERMKERFLNVAKYLAFDPVKYHMENLFADVKMFHAAYARAAADNAKRRALEERQKKAAEEQERRNREREEKARKAASGGDKRGPAEEDANVIDNLMEALKSGAAFGDGNRTGGQRRPRGRVAPTMSPTASASSLANKQKRLMRDRSRNYGDRAPTIVDVT